MSEFFSKTYSDFSGNTGKITIATGPVIMSHDSQKILLHISSSTGKYQFIGGRLDDTFSLTENALMRAKEVVGSNTVSLLDTREPLILLDEVERDGISEKVLLIHYGAHIEDENNVGEGEWFTLDEIRELEKIEKTSSANMRIASEYFLKV